MHNDRVFQDLAPSVPALRASATIDHQAIPNTDRDGHPVPFLYVSS